MTKPIRREIREDCSCQGSTLDSGESVIRGVKVIGYASKNGRRYTPEAITDALRLYEGAKVNLDHPQGAPNSSRRVVERFGKLTNVRSEGDGAKADLAYNPHLPLSKAVEWFAEHMPDALGLSHNAVGQGQTDEDGVFVVEKIVSVRSVDLVADPATTTSLFEDCMDPLDTPAPLADAGDTVDEPGHEEHLANAIAAIVKNKSLDMAAKLKKIKAALKIMDDDEGLAPSPDDPVVDDLEDDEEDEEDKKDAPESVQSGEVTIESLQEEINRLKGEKTAKAERKQRKAKARQLCIQAGLPEHLVTTVFVEQVANAAPLAQKALIDDRRQVLVKKPTSAGKGQAKTLTEEEFKKTLTGQV